MFGNLNKPAFGTPAPNTSFGFGSAPAANANPFGQNQLFGKPATGAFGTPSTSTFGQPTSTSLFPSTQAQPTNLFQNANTTFGAPTSTQPGFGTGLFGQTQPTGGGLFNTSSTFGQQTKPTGFGFSTQSTQPTLFGQQQQQQPQTASLFQPSTSNLFGGTTAFGGQQQTGTVIKFNPVTGTDTMMKNGAATSINTKHMSITCMKEYENKSFEELRLEDYMAGRKGPQQQTGFGTATPFGGAPVSSAPSLFGQPDASKPAFGQSTGFGQTTSAFGQSTGFGIGNQQQQTSLFGKPTGFGAPTSSTPSFGFGSVQSSNPFGATQTKPFGSTSQPIFGATTSTTQSGFGTGLFGQTNTQNTTSSLFGKPTQPTTGFGTAQNTGFSFSTPASTQSASLFTQNKPLFGQTSTAGFGQTNTFGTNTSSPFGTSFAKPATQGFGTGQTSGFGSSLAGIQPQNTSLFGTAAAKPTGLFGSTTSTGLFGNTNTSFQPSTGFGLGQQQQPQQSLFPPPEQHSVSNLALLTSDPFGDAPHLAGLEPKLKNTTTSVAATDPKELKSLLDASKKVDTSNNNKLKVVPINGARDFLFEGISKSTDNLNSNEYVRTNCRRLVLKNRSNNGSDSFSKTDILKHILSPDENKENTSDINGSEMNTSTEFKVAPLKLNFDNTIDKQNVTVEAQVHEAINDSSLKETNLDKKQSVNSEIDSVDDLPSPKTSPAKKHPCGIICTRPEYYTLPKLEDLPQYLDEHGQCIVKGFTIGRKGYGNVYFPDEMDVAGLNIDELVHFRYREINVYPDDSKKPPIGQGLNRKAQVTLDNVYPRKLGTNTLIKDVGELLQMNFAEKLRRITVKKDAKFVDYRPETGSWVFKVDHFSKYGFNDSDEESENSQDTLKKKTIGTQKQEVTKTPQKSSEELAKFEQDLKKKDSKIQDKDDAKYDIDSDMFLEENQFQDEDILHQSMYIDNISEEDYPPVSMDMPMHLSYDPFKTSKNIQAMKSTLFAEDDRFSDGGGSHISIIRQYLDFPEDVASLPVIREDVIPKKRATLRPKVDKVYKFGDFTTPCNSIPCRNCQDMCAFKGKSFKIGWCKGFNFYKVSNEFNLRGQISLNSIEYDLHKNADTLQECLADSLEIVLEESCYSMDDESIPTFKVLKNHNYLKKQTNLFSKLVDKYGDKDSQYFYSIWTLAEALWGPDEDTIANRRYLLSEWLKSHTSHESHIKPSDEIFNFLSVFKINEAANLALDNRYPNLSLIISQLSITNKTKLFLQEQVESWHNSLATNHISLAIKKIYLLLSGIPLKEDCNIFNDVDWKRAFGMHLWYISPLGAPIENAIDLYEKSFEDQGYAEKPNPPYANTYSDSSTYDILYHMLLLYKKRVHRLSTVLNPATHTSDPLDYRLSWLILQLFLSLDVGIIDESEKNKLCTSFSNQLEALGEWEWAIFVLLHLEDNLLKKNLVLNVLDRNLSPETDKSVLDSQNTLVNRMRVPLEWIHTVKGEKLLLLERYFEAFNHLAYAGNYSTANDVLVKYLLPNLFINEQYDIIKMLIAEIQDGSRDILNWNNEAGLFIDFLELQNGVISSNMEEQIGLQTLLQSITDRITNFEIRTDQQKLCIAEMSKRCVIICKELCGKSNSGILATMPPDYKRHEALCQINEYSTSKAQTC